MKNIVELLQEKQLLFKSFKEIKPKALSSRKKIDLFVAVDTKGYYASIFYIEKKSRILSKEIDEYFLLHEKLEKHIDSRIKKKYVLIDASLCSKAKAKLEKASWKVWEL
ncbi:hypothetical protein MNB_SV-13-1681 [hydrothermal vent metagenome]|uniref:Endonuclease n=1 Tax=hydrothermal vent metagenome TaxID=652676 RepID=A0A1W1CH40_9ZZZZ